MIPLDTKICNRCKEEKEFSEFYTDKRTKNNCQSRCKDCCNTYNREFRKNNKEKCNLQDSKKREKFRETIRIGQRKYYENNKEKCRISSKKYHQENKEKCRVSNKKWRSGNRDKRNALEAKRRASKLNRTPAWADLEPIKEIYRQAKALEELTGIKFNIDHELPLQGELVSGLHVIGNLQILEASENLRKHNSFNI